MLPTKEKCNNVKTYKFGEWEAGPTTKYGFTAWIWRGHDFIDSTGFDAALQGITAVHQNTNTSSSKRFMIL